MEKLGVKFNKNMSKTKVFVESKLINLIIFSFICFFYGIAGALKHM